MCPGGIVRPDKEFSKKLDEQMSKAGVKVVEGYLDAPGHEFYFVLEADNVAALNDAVEMLRLVGDVKTVPVMKWSDAMQWAKSRGIQK
jgi:uncharacterized protein with GYD domain